MLEFRLSNEAAEDDEVAACIAAVCLMMQEPATDNLASERDLSGWRKAALLEGTGQARRISDAAVTPRGNKMWQAVKRSHLLALLAVLAVGGIYTSPAEARRHHHHHYGTVAPCTTHHSHHYHGGGRLAKPQCIAMPPKLDRPNIPVSLRQIRVAEEHLVPIIVSVAPVSVAPVAVAATEPALPQLEQFQNASNPVAGVLLADSTLPATGVDAAGTATDAAAPPEIPQPADTITAGGGTLRSDLRLVRVCLASHRTVNQISIPDGAILKDVATGDLLAQLPPQSRWQIGLRSPGQYGQVSFSGTYGNVRHAQVFIATRSEYHRVAFISGAVPTAPRMMPIPDSVSPRFWLPAMRTEAGTPRGRAYMLIPTQSDGVIGCGGHLYRGAIMVRPNAQGSFDLINYVTLEDYLLSVVPSEMPSRWPLEALKAQAIAARSDAVANMGKHEGEGYDLKATDSDQVYNGVGSESTTSNTAVAQTLGAVMRYQGNVISAYFHSASGGWTERAENVWSQPIPFLKAVPDYDDQAPSFSWSRSCSVNQAEQLLAQHGRSVGALLSLMPVARGQSPRVRYLMATGTAGTRLISGEEARRMFGLPSTNFNVGGQGDSYVFAGRGNGHGLGMSQWGAKRLAEAGYSANDILNYYYKDVSIERL